MAEGPGQRLRSVSPASCGGTSHGVEVKQLTTTFSRSSGALRENARKIIRACRPVIAFLRIQIARNGRRIAVRREIDFGKSPNRPGWAARFQIQMREVPNRFFPVRPSTCGDGRPRPVAGPAFFFFFFFFRETKGHSKRFFGAKIDMSTSTNVQDWAAPIQGTAGDGPRLVGATATYGRWGLGLRGQAACRQAGTVGLSSHDDAHREGSRRRAADTKPGEAQHRPRQGSSAGRLPSRRGGRRRPSLARESLRPWASERVLVDSVCGLVRARRPDVDRAVVEKRIIFLEIFIFFFFFRGTNTLSDAGRGGDRFKGLADRPDEHGASSLRPLLERVIGVGGSAKGVLAASSDRRLLDDGRL